MGGNLNDLMIVNRYSNEQSKPKTKRKSKIKKKSMIKKLIKSKTTEKLAIVKGPKIVEKTSHQINMESLVSKDSIPSEFPLLKKTVKRLLNKNTATKYQSQRGIFSPFSSRGFLSQIGSPGGTKYFGRNES